MASYMYHFPTTALSQERQVILHTAPNERVVRIFVADPTRVNFNMGCRGTFAIFFSYISNNTYQSRFGQAYSPNQATYVDISGSNSYLDAGGDYTKDADVCVDFRVSIDTDSFRITSDLVFVIQTAFDEDIHSGYYNGSSWDGVIPMYYNGTNWVECEYKRYNGSSWDNVDTY